MASRLHNTLMLFATAATISAALLLSVSSASASQFKTPFAAPPVTDPAPLTVVVLRDTTEPTRSFRANIPQVDERQASEKAERVTRVRRRRTRTRPRRKRVDSSWKRQVLQNN